MSLVEKNGAYWLDDPTDIRTQPLYEYYDSKLDLLGIVVRSPSGHFVAAIYERGSPGPWRLGMWEERRPEAIFATEAEAISPFVFCSWEKTRIKDSHVGRASARDWFFTSFSGVFSSGTKSNGSLI